MRARRSRQRADHLAPVLQALRAQIVAEHAPDPVPPPSQPQPQPQTLSASTSLLSICFVIIGGLELTNSNSKSYADEIAWGASVLLLTSTIASYCTLGPLPQNRFAARVAHVSFLAAAAALLVSVLTMAIAL